MSTIEIVFRCTIALMAVVVLFAVGFMPMFKCSSCHKWSWPWKLFFHSESGGISCNSCGPCMQRIYGWTDDQIGKKKQPPKSRYEILIEDSK